MAYRRTDAVRKMIRELPAAMTKDVLRGAARAAVKVVADEARDRCIASETREDIATKVSAAGGKIIGKVFVKKGWGRSIGIWVEYGTDPHFISVDDSQRQGMSVRKINDAHKRGSLVINGVFVGETIHHPGARAHPFLRPALDTKQQEAVAAAQGYIAQRAAAGTLLTGAPETDA